MFAPSHEGSVLSEKRPFVTMDFQRDQLGFDARKRTFWLWEGVTMYLRTEDVADQLASFAALSTPGSRIALTYLRKQNGRPPRSLFLRMLGEPLRSAFEPAEITELARARSWRLISDTTPGLRLRRRRIGLQWLESIWVGEV